MPRRITATNKVTGEKVSFDWDHPEPPTREDIENISDQRRTAKIEASKKMEQNDANIPIIDKILTSKPGQFALNTLGALGFNQPWHPVEGLSNVGEGMSKVIQGTQPAGQPPVAHPRIAGGVQAVKGAMQTLGPVATAVGYAAAPIPTAATMLIGSGTSEATHALTPESWSPEVREAVSTGAGLLAGAKTAHSLSDVSPVNGRTRPIDTATKVTGEAEPRSWRTGQTSPVEMAPELPPPVPKRLPAPMGPPEAPQGFHPLDPTVMPQEAPPGPKLLGAPEDLPAVPYGPEPAPPPGIPMPPAGTFNLQRVMERANRLADERLAQTPAGRRAADVSRLNALADRVQPQDPGLTKPVSAPSEVSTVQPAEPPVPVAPIQDVAPEPVRSQVEQTPPPTPPVPVPAPQIEPPPEPPVSREVAPVAPPTPEALTPEVLPPLAPKPVEALTVAQRAMQKAKAIQPPVKPQAPLPAVPPVLPSTAPVASAPAPAPIQAPPPPPAPVAPPPQVPAPVPQTPPAQPPAPPTSGPGPVTSIAARAIEAAKNKPGPVRPPGFKYEPPPAPTLLDTISTGSKDPKLQGAIKRYIKGKPDWTAEEAGAHLAQEMPKINKSWSAYSSEAFTDYARGIKQMYDSVRATETAIPEEPPPPPTPPAESELAPPVQEKVNRTNEVLDFLKRRSNVTTDQIQRQFGMPKTEVMPIIRDLMSRQLVDAKTGKYNYRKMPGEKITPAPAEPTGPGDVAPVTPPKATEPGAVGPVDAPEVKTPEAKPEAPKPAKIETPKSAREQHVEQLRKDWQDEEDPILSKAYKSQYENEAKNLQIEKSGTKKQKEILAQLDNVSKKVDELEAKDSDGTITKEEQSDLADQYKQLNKLEKQRDDSLIPDEEKYGPRVANIRSLHAERELSGLTREQLSDRSKQEFKGRSVSQLEPQEVAKLEDMLKTERLDREAEIQDLEEKEINGEATPAEQKRLKDLCNEMGGGH